MRNYLTLIGKIHDIGKATLIFQERAWRTLQIKFPEGIIFPEISPKYREQLHHSTSGSAVLRSLGFNDGTCTIVGSHHGRWRVNLSKSYLEAYRSALTGVNEQFKINYFFTEWEAIVKEALETTNLKIEELPNPGKSEQMLLTGILNMADWLSSDTRYFPLFSDEYDSSSAQSRYIGIEEKFCITEPWTSLHYQNDVDSFISTFHMIPRAVQKDVIELLEKVDESGLLIIEAPMGCGKTEAALYAAQIMAYFKQAGGIFYGLPTIATSNGIMERIYSWAENECQFSQMSFQLAHSKTLFNEKYEEVYKKKKDESGLIISPWMEKKKLRLCPNFVVGTIDYLLRMALKHNHIMLDHIGVSGKIVILDEIHCYDAYMNEYLFRALEWLGYYGTPVILLSATLHSSLRKEMIQAYSKGAGLKFDDEEFQKCLSSQAYPLLTFAGANHFEILEDTLSSKQKKVYLKKFKDWNPIHSNLKTRLKNGGCAGIIVNTVRQAQQLYNDLQSLESSGFRLELLHSSFTDCDRSKIEKELLNILGKPANYNTKTQNDSRQKLIVIGTQVLEQSLDIDFDWLITEICPIDLLFQRIGRLHRHSRTRPENVSKAECWVIGESMDGLDSGTRSVYPDWLLYRTLKVLEGTEFLHLPGDIPLFIEKVYESGFIDSSENSFEPDYFSDYLLKAGRSRSKASCYLLGSPLIGKDIRNILNVSVSGKEDEASQAVRDCGISIEVILVLTDFQSTAFTSDKHLFALSDVPGYLESKTLLRSKIKLPGFFTKPYLIKNIIHELEINTQKYFSQWIHSKILSGELVLPLSLNGTGKLAGFFISYSAKTGFQYRKDDENDELESD